MSDDEWWTATETMAAHVAGYPNARAVEGAARRYGTTLGEGFLDLLARRLRDVSADRDGALLSLPDASRRVREWAASADARPPATGAWLVLVDGVALTPFASRGAACTEAKRLALGLPHASVAVTRAGDARELRMWSRRRGALVEVAT
jgi:hypothetical protein